MNYVQMMKISHGLYSLSHYYNVCITICIFCSHFILLYIFSIFFFSMDSISFLPFVVIIPSTDAILFVFLYVFAIYIILAIHAYNLDQIFLKL